MYSLGFFSLEEIDNKLILRYPYSKDDEKLDLKFKILLFSVWILATTVPTAVSLFLHRYAHAALFFVIFGGGGLYIVINIIKREVLKYYSVQVDNDGIHEIWSFPNKVESKTILWENLKCSNIYVDIVKTSAKPPILYDCILFSSESTDDAKQIKFIRKTFGSSLQYELKFRNVRNSIYIIVRSNEGEVIYDYIVSYVNKKTSI